MCIYKNVDALTFDKTKFDLKSRQIEACRPSTNYERRPIASACHTHSCCLSSLSPHLEAVYVEHAASNA